MRTITAAGIAAFAVLAAAGAASAAEPSVQIKDAVARVTVIPSDRADVQVVIKTPNGRLPLKVERKGDKIVVDGDLRWNKIRNCVGSVGNASVDVRDVGKVAWKDLPEIVVYTPRKANVSVSGAVFGYIGRAEAISLDNAGCGDWTLGNVAGKLEISQAGSGDVFGGSAGSLDLSVAGSGDTRLQAVGAAEINIAGSGDVTMASMAGDLDVSIAGSGDVRVFGGRAGKIDVSVAGSGDVRFAGSAGQVDATFMGSGDLWVTRVDGQVDKTVMGSGAVHVGPFEMKRD